MSIPSTVIHFARIVRKSSRCTIVSKQAIKVISDFVRWSRACVIIRVKRFRWSHALCRFRLSTLGAEAAARLVVDVARWVVGRGTGVRSDAFQGASQSAREQKATLTMLLLLSCRRRYCVFWRSYARALIRSAAFCGAGLCARKAGDVEQLD